MSTAIATKDDAKLYESLALRGDLSMLTPEQKAGYYGSLCERLGLDAATQPFMPLKLNGKEILYASRGCTDQLARKHRVNRQIVKEEELRGVYVVTVEATLPDGRREQSKGAVTVENLKGDAFCNAIMKAETKAKRRATLSILGLGMLDEVELETVPAYIQPGPTPDPHVEEAVQVYNHLAKAEPTEPQPTIASQADAVAELRMLNHKCGWDDAKLLKWLTRKFMMADGLKLNDALLSLGEGELAEAIQMFQSHLEAKARAEAA